MSPVGREWRREPLYHLDPELNELLRCELIPQQETLELIASGLRVGSPAVTTRGFMEPEMHQTGELMLRALAARDSDAALAEIRRDVVDLLDRSPLYESL